MTGALSGSNLAGLLDGTAEKEQFLCDGSFAGVGVTDYGKGAAFLDFYLVEQFHGVQLLVAI